MTRGVSRRRVSPWRVWRCRMMRRQASHSPWPPPPAALVRPRRAATPPRRRLGWGYQRNAAGSGGRGRRPAHRWATSSCSTVGPSAGCRNPHVRPASTACRLTAIHRHPQWKARTSLRVELHARVPLPPPLRSLPPSRITTSTSPPRHPHRSHAGRQPRPPPHRVVGEVHLQGWEG